MSSYPHVKKPEAKGIPTDEIDYIFCDRFFFGKLTDEMVM
jgi:hypothetical protein